MIRKIECPNCEGTGDLGCHGPCPRCNGTGEVEEEDPA